MMVIFADCKGCTKAIASARTKQHKNVLKRIELYINRSMCV